MTIRSRFLRKRISLLLLCGAGIFSTASSAGLPGEHLLTERWRYLFSSHSALSNPAFINEENYFSLRFLFASTLQEFYKHELSATMPLGLYQSAGVSWFTQSAGTYDGTIVDPVTGDIVPSGTAITDQDNFFLLTYANNFWNRFTIGANINISHQIIPSGDNEVRMGFGADVGLTYKAIRNPVIGNHMLGVSTTNLLSIIPSSEENYSTALRFSLISDYWERHIESGIDFVIKDIISDAGVFDGGAKLTEWDATARIGFWLLRMANIYALTGLTNYSEGIDYIGFGVGFNTPSFTGGRDLQAIYQFINIFEGEATQHTVYLRSDIGLHREERYARKMARLISLAPNQLYDQARALYYGGNYWDANILFMRIKVEYPDFGPNDWVSYYMASCFEKLDMQNISESTYTKAIEEYRRSVTVPFNDLGLMRLAYRRNDDNTVRKQFEELNKLGVPDSLKFHAHYLKGQVALQQGNYTRARQLFTAIPDDHPDFIYANHSAAVANMLTDNIQGAISDLENSVQATAQDDAQQEIINRSYVFLGYLFYEDLSVEGALARAVTALRLVPRTSTYYVDALLGLGWTGLKARQWSDCTNAGRELVRVSTHPVIQAEGLLLQSYAMMMQRNYAQAAGILGEASGLLDRYQRPSEAELNRQKAEYEETRRRYNQFGNHVGELGNTRHSTIVLAQFDSLHTHQRAFERDIDQYKKFVHDFQRRSFFARSFQEVKDDVEYAWARAQRSAGTRRADQADQAALEEQRRIEQELEELRRQLEQAE